MKLRLAAVLAGAVVMLGLPAAAHHSFSATYHIDEQMTIEGRLVAFLYRNPHAFLHVNVTDEDGDTARWAIEWGGAAVLTSQSVTRETLKPGDFVVVTGNPGRNPEDHRMRMQHIERPSDGWAWGGEFD
ncbi:MAG: DUF6152 family protein [Rhodospirillaceae bacterium]|nr:DUF6152 family protein [Rhodospirillaceae bacterium]MDD9999853.1 DUF6152 family protein [Rhodospirillaceae bacterium]MDE0362878.1 DUF6152 family protein [Rhodospirillaceae bacterium]